MTALILVSNAHGEMRVALDVLDSILQAGPLKTVEIPAANVLSQKTLHVASKAALIARELNDEADRLEDQVRHFQKTTTDIILPLVQRGWRVARTGDGWLIDYGLQQLFHAVPPGRVDPKTCLKLNLDGTMAREEEERQVLLIDEVIFYQQISTDNDIERVLLMRQWELLSSMIFSLLQRQARSRADLLYDEIDIVSFYVAKLAEGDQKVNIRLEPGQGVTKSEWTPRFSYILRAFRDNPEAIIDCVL